MMTVRRRRVRRWFASFDRRDWVILVQFVALILMTLLILTMIVAQREACT